MKLKLLVWLVASIILSSAAAAWAGLTQNQVSELYVSIFNRASEGGGNTYWRSQPDMAAAATAMLATQAAQNYFGTSLNSNHAFIEHIYLNTLNKEYWDDPIGITYWVNSLDNGKTRGEVVAELVGVIGDYAPGGPYYDSNEAATVIAYKQFTNRVAVSSYMADVVVTPPAGWETITQLGAVGLNVTDDENSVNLAKLFIDNLTSDDNNNDNPVITVGESEDIAAQDIPPTGDVIVINQPGNPLHGMEIIVPPGAYDDTRQFQVSSAPVLSHAFGELLEPLTPMITVENGGDHSEETMTVQIPVQIPQGWFATAFFFDKDQEKLEPMQLISTENDVVTVNTRHFSDFIVTGIPQSILENYLIEGIRSDFYPGVDDFSFINRGSYIAPGGHCAGQSIGAMWYYTAKPEGNQPLWGSYDNNFSDRPTPDLWEDDSYAYRFCSVLQEDLDGGSFAIKFWREAQGRVWKKVNNQWQWVDVPGIGPESTRNLFALSILLTGEPQYVTIWSKAGGGHAMIVYAVTRDALHIADPNYPGDINRTIYYSHGAFDPYPSGDNWEEINAGRGKLYETILYLAKSTLMPWEHIAGRWQEVKDGTIGNDLFPGYDIKYLNEDSGEYELLGENQVFTKDKGDFYVSSAGGQEIMSFSIYRDEELVPFDADWKTDLVSGDNLLGFYIKAKLGDDRKYVDFQYVNVICEPSGQWQLVAVQDAGYSPYIPNSNFQRDLQVTSSPSDTVMTWIYPEEEMEVHDRLTYTFDGNATSHNVETMIQWTDTIYPDSGKQSVDMTLTLIRQWTPDPFPQTLRPGTVLEITESVTTNLTPDPSTLGDWPQYVPEVFGLMQTQVDGVRLKAEGENATTYTHIDTTDEKGSVSTQTMRWNVPDGISGNQLVISFRAMDSGSAGLGHSYGSYLDHFQSAGKVMIYQFR